MGEKAAREADPFSLSLPSPEQLFSLKFNCKVIARGWRFMEVEFHEFKTTSFLKKNSSIPFLLACPCTCILPSSLLQVLRWHLVRRGGKRRHNVFQTLRNTLKIPFRALEILNLYITQFSIILDKRKDIWNVCFLFFKTKVSIGSWFVKLQNLIEIETKISIGRWFIKL